MRCQNMSQTKNERDMGELKTHILYIREGMDEIKSTVNDIEKCVKKNTANINKNTTRLEESWDTTKKLIIVGGFLITVVTFIINYMG